MTTYSSNQIATFAGGCFWCLQDVFDHTKGVTHTVVGYAGGNEVNPTYEDVSLGLTQHVEAIQITFDENKISYKQLLDIFWHNIDPTNDQGQFCDTGAQYRTVIFYHNKEQEKEAFESQQALTKKFEQITTQIRPFTTFYAAQDYHQEYYKKHPAQYKYYHDACGRDQKLKEIWKK